MRDSERALPASKKKAEGRMEKKGTILLEVVAGGVVRRGGGSRGGGALGHLPCGGLGRGDKGSKGRGLDPTWIKRRLATGELEVGHAAARGRLGMERRREQGRWSEGERGFGSGAGSGWWILDRERSQGRERRRRVR